MRRFTEGTLGVLLVLFFAEGCPRSPKATDAGSPDATEVASRDAEPDIVTPPTPGGPDRWAVVIVAANDVLNVRAEANPNADIVHRLAPTARGIRSSGRPVRAASAQWIQISHEGHTGWVNTAFLTEDVDAARFAADARPRRLLDQLAAAVTAKGDIGGLLGPRGLYLAHFDKPRRFPLPRARALLSDATRRTFNGAACGDACLEGTFAEIVGRAYLDVFEDADKRIAPDTWLKGGNSSANLPAELSGFRYLALYDPGDLEDAPDWQTVVVFFEYVEGEPRIVGLARDAWSP